MWSNHYFKNVTKNVWFQVINQHLQQFQPAMMAMEMPVPSHSSSWETGYGSGHDNVNFQNFQAPPRARYNPEATYIHKDEVETEIFWEKENLTNEIQTFNNLQQKNR